MLSSSQPWPQSPASTYTGQSYRGRERIVALSGATGVGKTSLLQAGLVPILEARRGRGDRRTRCGSVGIPYGWSPTCRVRQPCRRATHRSAPDNHRPN
ncbi:hypothetical protein ACQP1G_17505 [Nocardia sp. CA-107356]|uniref:nSTAND1 domain-containing NTPase n=1 Tax=Nocardia sp. CA-107356 TaxID=3239972 RepID=UPI003D8DD4F7